MNIEDWLHADARRDGDNPLEARLGGLVDRVRSRRRRRAATQAAGVVTVVAAGLVVWQVGGPWDRPAPPPATDPPLPAPTEETTTPPTESDWCGAEWDSVTGDAQILDGAAEVSGDLTLDITVRSENELALSPAVDLAVTVPGSEEVIAYSEGSADGELVVPAGEDTSLTRGLDDLVLCEDGFTGAADITVGAFAADGGTWQLADLIAVTFEDGTITTTGDESSDDAADGSDGENESPDAGDEISAPESYEPTCGQAWEPPTAYTGWEVVADFSRGPYQASPDGSTGGLSSEFTVRNTATEELTADTYTQVVLVQDGTVVAPAMLGSDHVVETSLAAGEETTQSGGHQLWDVCDDSWTGVGPSLPAGEYGVYVLLLDAGPYWDNGDRAVLAVTEGQTIEVTE